MKKKKGSKYFGYEEISSEEALLYSRYEDNGSSVYIYAQLFYCGLTGWQVAYLRVRK